MTRHIDKQPAMPKGEGQVAPVRRRKRLRDQYVYLNFPIRNLWKDQNKACILIEVRGLCMHTRILIEAPRAGQSERIVLEPGMTSDLLADVGGTQAETETHDLAFAALGKAICQGLAEAGVIRQEAQERPEARPALALAQEGHKIPKGGNLLIPDYQKRLPGEYWSFFNENGRLPTRAELAERLAVSEKNIQRRVTDIRKLGGTWPPPRPEHKEA